jgi:hypothetical protein
VASRPVGHRPQRPARRPIRLAAICAALAQ